MVVISPLFLSKGKLLYEDVIDDMFKAVQKG